MTHPIPVFRASRLSGGRTSLLTARDTLASVALTDDALAAADCVFVHTAHASIDWSWVHAVAGDKLVDSRGVTPGLVSSLVTPNPKGA